MSNENDPQPTPDTASEPSTADHGKVLVEVTIPVPAAHLGSFFQTVGGWLQDHHPDEGWRGGRMT